MKKYLLRTVAIFSSGLWLISACIPPSHPLKPKPTGFISSVEDGTHDPVQEHGKKLRKIYLQGPSYQGDVTLNILLGEQNTSLNLFPDFKVQSGATPLIYHENFTGTAENRTIERTLSQAKVTRQYTLTLAHLNYDKATTQAEAEVKIDGITLLTLPATEQQTSRSKFSLRPDSQLQITLKNAAAQSLSVNIAEGEATGAVIHKRTTPMSQKKTSEQAKAQLAQILASLPPSMGNKNQRFPEVQNASISMNGHPPENVAMGQLFISLNEPVAANLAAIQEAFNAVVIQGPIDEDTYLIAPDLSRTDISQIEQDLKTVNSRISDPYLLIRSVNFGDLESAKSLAFALRMTLDERVHSVGFNPLLSTSNIDSECSSRPIKDLIRDNPGVRTVEDTKAPLYLDLVGSLKGEYQEASRLSGHSQWWTNKSSTWINHAWKYSTGYNRSDKKRVRVAVIDQGFAGLSQLNAPAQDMTGRIRFDLGGIVVNDPYFLRDIGKSNAPEGDVFAWDFTALEKENHDFENAAANFQINPVHFHGTQVSSTIAAGINNGIGIAGVAPEAEIVPIKAGTSSERLISTRQFDGSIKSTLYAGRDITWSSVYTALKTAQSAEVDVVNISMNNGDVDFFLKGFFDNLSQKQWIRPMQSLIQQMTDEGIIIVASAGNFGWLGGFTLPGKRYFPEILVVGAVRQIPLGTGTGTGSVPLKSHIIANIYNNPEGTQIHSTPCLEVSTIESNVNMQELAKYQTVRQVVAKPDDFWKTLKVGSNYGNASDVDIWAPGTNLLALGPHYFGTSYWTWSDTSAAAPIVAGTAALIKALRPDIQTQEVRQLLRQSATRSQDNTGFERSLPFPDLNLKVRDQNYPEKDSNATKCGKARIGKDDYYINCGTVQPTSTSIYTLNALEAMSTLPGVVPVLSKAKVYYGHITPIASELYYLEQKDNRSDALIFPLSPDVQVPGGFFSEDENFINNFDVFLNTSPRRSSTSTSTPQYYPVCINWQGLDSCIQHMQSWYKNAYPPVNQTLYNALAYNSPDRYIKVLGWPEPMGIRVLSLTIVNEEDVPEEEKIHSGGGVGPSSDPSGYPSSYPSDSPSEDPSPTPLPSFEPSLAFSAPVVVSQVAGASNTRSPANLNVRSALKEGPFGSYAERTQVNFLEQGPAPAAQWVGFVDTQQAIRQSYPKVPNTHQLSQNSESFKLRILVQVKNQGKGGTVVIEAGGNERREAFGPGTAYENAELRPIRFDFFDSARESSGGLVKIQLIGGVDNAQIIYKMFAVPYED